MPPKRGGAARSGGRPATHGRAARGTRVRQREGCDEAAVQPEASELSDKADHQEETPALSQERSPNKKAIGVEGSNEMSQSTDGPLESISDAHTDIDSGLMVDTDALRRVLSWTLNTFASQLRETSLEEAVKAIREACLRAANGEPSHAGEACNLPGTTLSLLELEVELALGSHRPAVGTLMAQIGTFFYRRDHPPTPSVLPVFTAPLISELSTASSSSGADTSPIATVAPKESKGGGLPTATFDVSPRRPDLSSSYPMKMPRVESPLLPTPHLPIQTAPSPPTVNTHTNSTTMPQQTSTHMKTVLPSPVLVQPHPSCGSGVPHAAMHSAGIVHPPQVLHAPAVLPTPSSGPSQFGGFVVLPPQAWPSIAAVGNLGCSIRRRFCYPSARWRALPLQSPTRLVPATHRLFRIL